MRLSYRAKHGAVLKLIDDLDFSLAVASEVVLKLPKGNFGDSRQSDSRRHYYIGQQ